MLRPSDIKFAFFGTDDFSVIVLDKLEEAGFLPTVVITPPDKPVGRKQIITPPLTKVWAEKRNVKILQPENLKNNFAEELRKIAPEIDFDIFITASYGKIVPEDVLKIPKKGCLNVHPSLLPLFRGPSPIESTILENNKTTGVTIMLMDKGVDSGPIIAQEIYEFSNWPKRQEVENTLADLGGKLLANIIIDWIEGNIDEQEQDSTLATYTKKIIKSDAIIDLKEDPRKNFLKIQAYAGWPEARFVTRRTGRKISVIIKDAIFENGELKIKRVLPEGGKEMDYEDFLRGVRE